MKIQEIEIAVLKQLPFRKSDALNNREFATKDIFRDAGMIIVCGLASAYIDDARKVAVNYYDINKEKYLNNVRSYHSHVSRIGELMEYYGVKIEEPNSYRNFSNAFWRRHNEGSNHEPYKDGVILSHVISSKRTFTNFLQDPFIERDYVSFFVYNKAQLAQNYLRLHRQDKEYVNFLQMAF